MGAINSLVLAEFNCCDSVHNVASNIVIKGVRYGSRSLRVMGRNKYEEHSKYLWLVECFVIQKTLEMCGAL